MTWSRTRGVEFVDVAYFPYRTGEAEDVARLAVACADSLRRAGVETRVVAKGAPSYFHIEIEPATAGVAATVQARAEEVGTALDCLANEDGVIYLRRVGRDGVRLQPGETLLCERGELARSLVRSDLRFWRTAGSVTKVAFLPIIAPFAVYKSRRLRREINDLARHPGVTAASVTFGNATSLGGAFTDGWSYAITTNRVIAYHGPVVELVPRSRITGLMLSEAGDGTSGVILTCRGPMGHGTQIFLAYAARWWHDDLPIAAIAAPALVHSIFEQAANGRSAKEIAKGLAAECALGTKAWKPGIVEGLIANPDLQRGHSPWGLIEPDLGQAAQEMLERK